MSRTEPAGRSGAAGPSPSEPSDGRWWRHPMLWLVVGGPAMVVVAATITAVIAFRGADPVVSRGAAADAADLRAGSDELPALQARNQGAAATAAATRPVPTRP